MSSSWPHMLFTFHFWYTFRIGRPWCGSFFSSLLVGLLKRAKEGLCQKISSYRSCKVLRAFDSCFRRHTADTASVRAPHMRSAVCLSFQCVACPFCSWLAFHCHCEPVSYLSWWPTYSSCRMSLTTQHPEEEVTFESWLHTLVSSAGSSSMSGPMLPL